MGGHRPFKRVYCKQSKRNGYQPYMCLESFLSACARFLTWRDIVLWKDAQKQLVLTSIIMQSRIFVVNKASFTDREHKKSQVELRTDLRSNGLASLLEWPFQCYGHAHCDNLISTKVNARLDFRWLIPSPWSSKVTATCKSWPNKVAGTCVYIWPDLQSHSLSNWHPLINVGH